MSERTAVSGSLVQTVPNVVAGYVANRDVICGVIDPTHQDYCDEDVEA